MALSVCHVERSAAMNLLPPALVGAESKHPDAVSLTMQLQGVLLRNVYSAPLRRGAHRAPP
jgi:hypothetical protein